jgi:hypothetical protein
MKPIYAAATGLLTLAAALAPPTARAEAPKAARFSYASMACTDTEQWVFGQRIPPKWRDKMVIPFPDKAGRGKFLYQTEILRESSRFPEAKILSEYWHNRALFDLKLVHAAHRGFESMVARQTTPEEQGIKLAALNCLNRIHQAYPTMRLSPATVQALRSIPVRSISRDSRQALWKAVSVNAQLAISRGATEAQIATELQLLQGSGAFDAMVRMMMAAKKGDDAGVVQWGTEFFKIQGRSEFLKEEEDALHLLLARAHYNLQKHGNAVREFRLVKNTSNYITQALTDNSWAFLIRNKYPEAIGAAQNLMVGNLKNTFAPEANVIMAIAFNETCHFPEALEAIKYFRKSYNRALRWLYDWNAKVAAGQGPDLYQVVAAYLKKDKNARVPARVGTEWLRSPVFIGNQQELNLLYDEADAIKKVGAEIAQESSGKKVGKKWAAAGTRIRGNLAAIHVEASKREPALIAEIRKDLTARSKRMLELLADVSENVQLVEAEVYNSLGEKMIADNAMGIDPTKNEGKELKAKDEGPVWDWGRFPAKDDGDQEFWEDELGWLKSDANDKCPQS